MKVLILASPCSVWVKEFIQNVILPLEAEVFLQESFDRGSNYYDYYNEAGVKIIPFAPVNKWIMILPKVRAIIIAQHQRKSCSRHAPFDVVINMFVSPELLSQAALYKQEGSKVYAYFCGSDIIRSSKINSLRLKLGLKHCSGVICASSNVHEAYLHKIGYKINTPVETIRFGMSSFDFINAQLFRGDKCDYKSIWNIDPKKLTICIGYNASEAQNHLAVLRQFQYLSKTTLSKITVLLQMTYGGNEEYIANVESAVSGLGCDFKLFRLYLNMPQIAQLRLLTDVFINAQVTDGLSGSVLEALYAGSILLNASWLHYNEYNEWGISYKTFLGFEQIPQLLAEAMDDTSKNDINREILKGQMTWQQCRDAWARLLK